MVSRLLRRQPVEQAKRAAKEKECRALSLGRSSNQVAQLREPSAARDRGSRKVEEREYQKKRHHQGRDNLSRDLFSAAPERKTPGPLFVVRRFCRTPRARRGERRKEQMKQTPLRTADATAIGDVTC